MLMSLVTKTDIRDRSHDDAMAEVFRDDPAYAVALLNDILEGDDQGELLVVLRQLTKAFGGVAAVAEKAQLNPTQMYRTLSEKGNPELSGLAAILKAMGFRLAIERIKSAA
jgi:probable addiction module antidote protein